MIDFPGSELLVVFVVALLVLGPKQLSSLAGALGRFLYLMHKQIAPLKTAWKSWQQEVKLAENELHARDAE